MSEENVEIVRRLVEAWNEHDEALAASYLADDIEWAPAGPAAVDRVVYRGPEEFARGFAAVWETWDEFRFREAEVRDLEFLPFGKSVSPRFQVELAWVLEAVHVEVCAELAVSPRAARCG